MTVRPPLTAPRHPFARPVIFGIGDGMVARLETRWAASQIANGEVL